MKGSSVRTQGHETSDSVNIPSEVLSPRTMEHEMVRDGVSFAHITSNYFEVIVHCLVDLQCLAVFAPSLIIDFSHSSFYLSVF